jgi:glyoxylase-like metal-dependent hydrolase (beta-lactamase superfamily II)
MKAWSYTRGLHDLGNSVYAYLQPDGSWGWSNAGIVTSGTASLLIDTLFDLKLTQEMLDTMRRSIPAAAHIDMLVNTHANGDHCYGNQLVAGAQIIASARTAGEMVTGVSPGQMAALLKMAPAMGQLGEFMGRIFSPFEFDNITLTLPDKTFEGKLTIQVGDRTVELLEVGPAHTLGDTLVHIPADRVIFTGDILFIGGHPIMWAGPTSNWIRACDLILSLDVETIVPGHGPITDKKGVVEVKGYLEYIYAEARKRYEAGMPALDAARDIPLDRYASWSEGERVAVNVISIYRELSGDQTHPSVASLFGQMAALALQPGTQS